MNLLEATSLALQHKLVENKNNVDTEQVCRDLEKIRSFKKVEYIEADHLFGYNCVGYYKLYISKHLIKLANQYNIGLSGINLRFRIIHSIEEKLSKYYSLEEYKYGFNASEDYNGYWYWTIE